jgi:hypothetical protein
MRFITVLVLIFLGKAAFANPFHDVSPNQPVCLAAKYSAEYMSEHPYQKTSDIWMKLYMQKDPADPTLYLNMQLTVSGTVYRAGMLCDRKPNGSVHCVVECDGGQAEIWQNDQAAADAFFVNKGIYITAVCDPTEQPVRLEPTPGGDDIFDLKAEPCP